MRLEVQQGAGEFAASIDTATQEDRPLLRLLLHWAQSLAREGLASLYTSIGKDRWVLNPR